MDIPEDESFIEYPCQFPIKCMGITGDTLEEAVLCIFNEHVPDLSEGALRLRPSSKGKYTAITVTINATSRAQLDAIYQALSDSEHILMAL